MATHTTTVCTLTRVKAGNAIWVAFCCDDDGNPGTTATCADSKGNTYDVSQTVQASATGSATGVRVALFVALNATPLAIGDTVTVTHGAVVASHMWVFSTSGIATSSALDTSSTNIQAGTSAPTSNAAGTLSQSEAIWIGVVAAEATGTAVSPVYVVRDLTSIGNGSGTSGGGAASNVASQIQYLLATDTSGKTAGLSTAPESRDWATLVASFKCQPGAYSLGSPKLVLNGAETAITWLNVNTNTVHSVFVDGSPYLAAGIATVGVRSSGTSAKTSLYECGILIAWDDDKGHLSNLRRRKPIDVRV